jgi:hypothetical protein
MEHHGFGCTHIARWKEETQAEHEKDKYAGAKNEFRQLTLHNVTEAPQGRAS